MTIDEAFEWTKNEVIGDNLIITSVEEAETFHDRFIKLRTELFLRQITDIMPHYRGEQNFGWDIRSGIFRPPMTITDPVIGKTLERQAIDEFENVINQKVGKNVLRDVFNNEKHGKDWDLLFQAQHAGIKTTLTDWTAFIVSALYFATEESNVPEIENADGQIWCFIVPTVHILGHTTLPSKNFYQMNPYEMKGTYLINPSSYLDNIQDRIFEYRMFRQKGRFLMCSNETCHIPVNNQPHIQQYLFRIRIPAEHKGAIRNELAERAVKRSEMYIDENPDRQNLITEINTKIFH